MKKRAVDIVVISDVHLGTYGCHASELLHYLKSIRPKTLILNGDIVDIWQFSKSYWPKSHMKVVKHIMGLIAKGVNVYYIPGNHDETLRRFAGFNLGSFRIVNKVLLMMPDAKISWIFHGDVFDVTMRYSKWLAKLGAIGYDLLILINRAANFISERILKKGKISFSKKIKNSVKGAVKFINNFEETAAGIGISNNYDFVVCGHIHHPEIREISNKSGSITYLNSGDWVENLSSLEYHDGEWTIHRFDSDCKTGFEEEEEEQEPNNKELFNELLKEFNIQKA